MSKKTMDIIAIVLGIIRKLGPVMMLAGFLWMIGIAGTSDLEAEIGEILHSNSWYIINSLKALTLFAAGFGCYGYAYPIYRAIKRANRNYIVRCYNEIKRGA